MTTQRKTEIDTSPLGEFDRFCRFIDGMHMGGFVENDFMCKAIQKKIRAELIRAHLSPPVPDDVADDKLHTLEYALGWAERFACDAKVKNKDMQIWVEKLREAAIRAASTPPVPVDTIAVPREVVDEVRVALQDIMNRNAIQHWFNTDRQRKALASLDAVLAEGE